MNSSPVWARRPERSKLVSPEHWGVGPGKGIIGNSSGHENEPGDSKFISRITVVLDCTFPSNRLGGEWVNVYIWLSPIKKAREFQKNIYFCFIDYARAFDCVDHNKLENSEREGNTRPADLPPEKCVCRSRSNS